MSDRDKVDDEDGTPPSSAKRRGAGGSDSRGGKGSAGKGSGRRARNSNWGRVLRTAYDDTLREPVPDDFRDLLGKLD